MIEKLVYFEKEEQLPSWYKVTQNNSVPPNWKEITAEEFAQSKFFTYGFSHSEYRQFLWSQNGWFSGRLFYICGRPEGVAMTNQYSLGKYRVRYFSFAECIHEWEGVSRKRMEELAQKFPQLKGKGTWGNCCHNSVCTKCGDYWFVDSSD